MRCGEAYDCLFYAVAYWKVRSLVILMKVGEVFIDIFNREVISRLLKSLKFSGSYKECDEVYIRG